MSYGLNELWKHWYQKKYRLIQCPIVDAMSHGGPQKKEGEHGVSIKYQQAWMYHFLKLFAEASMFRNMNKSTY